MQDQTYLEDDYLRVKDYRKRQRNLGQKDMRLIYIHLNNVTTELCERCVGYEVLFRSHQWFEIEGGHISDARIFTKNSASMCMPTKNRIHNYENSAKIYDLKVYGL